MQGTESTELTRLFHIFLVERIHEPIPHSLCSNTRINGGLTRSFGCDAILCGLGTTADGGFAREPDGCVTCDEMGSTLYLGSIDCMMLHAGDVLSMMFDILNGERWSEDDRRGWQEMGIPLCEWSGITVRLS